MANEITIIVKSRNEAGPGLNAVERDTDRLKARAAELGAEFRRTATATDQFGNKLRGNATFADFLGQKIRTAREEVHRLEEDFNRSGNSSLIDRIFSSHKAIGELEQVKKKLTSTLEQGTKDAGPGVLQSLKNMFAGGGGLIPGLVGAIVA